MENLLQRYYFLPIPASLFYLLLKTDDFNMPKIISEYDKIYAGKRIEVQTACGRYTKIINNRESNTH